MDRTFAIIIGAMKSGTSSLFSLLAQHPRILPSTLKEPHYFTDHHDRGFDWYLDCWPDRGGDGTATLLESSTSYTKLPAFPGAADRIRAVPDARFRFLYMMREPASRIESHLQHAWAERWSDATVDEALAPDSHFVEITRYAKQLTEYYERFPAEDILLLDFDEFRRDPLAVTRRAVAFLGLPRWDDFKDADTPKNAGGQRLQSDPVGSLAQRAPLLRALARPIPDSLKRFARSKLGTPIPRVRLDAAQRERLYEILADDLRRLRDDYGFRAAWNDLPEVTATSAVPAGPPRSGSRD